MFGQSNYILREGAFNNDILNILSQDDNILNMTAKDKMHLGMKFLYLKKA